ncbi:hypothetical protein BDR04DRAFT_1110860, partial [Suillus decipiens]
MPETRWSLYLNSQERLKDLAEGSNFSALSERRSLLYVVKAFSFAIERGERSPQHSNHACQKVPVHH